MTEELNTVCPQGQQNCPIFEEVSALRQDVERLNKQVHTDHLTGLNNKQHLFQALENEMERTRRSSQPTTIMLIDADHFKSVNDNHGHVIGDKVLQNLSHVIRRSIRKIDIPCRFGGEEFCVILPSTSSLVGYQVAERLRCMVEQSAISLESGENLSVTVSIGLSTYTSSSQISLEKFISLCDEQLYAAKNSGRNCVSMSEEDKTPQSTVSAEEKSALFSK